ncbi:organic cation/carnitine transporter 4 [Exaiptasia diaphana]|uniref:Major facilitator superfamily (MFS) profile domain-containing protein n=1 Tax=Exaiptasia diaphana TaxID=2652724 RepID=A0A913Y6R5_EXADI|nr:organic cation/carnitine transporter 4 [Exaiptasia diaphana]XP_020915613.1 organic cation/carnitine transporter 4 [Exaiptasia diaphana]KXJ22115.1 Organic cation/carnitine transporter 4 [Exaiptasia diaphana]
MAHNTEELINKIGSFGRYQVRLFLVASFMVFITTNVLMVMTFSTAEPPWRCTANATSCKLNGTFKPGDKNYEYRCDIPRSDWEFAVDGNFDSIVTEWDLVCKTSTYVSHVNSLAFLFWMLGSIVGSILSDKVGRKKVTFPFFMIVAVSGLISAIAKHYWVFAVFRSLVGIGLGGAGTTAFVLVLEYVGARHRGAVGIGIWFAFVFAMCFLALIAYLLPAWRLLTIVTSAPGLIGFVFWWFTPESLRWLLMKGKSTEAKKTLQKAASVNGKLLVDEDFMLIQEDNDERNIKLGHIGDLFTSRLVAYRTLVSWYCWCVCGMVYYGISLSTPGIGGNMYLNFFISAVCECVGMIIGIFCLDKFGRKKSIAASLWIGGVAMVAAALLSYYDDGSDGYLAGKILMTMVIGKFFITIAFDGIFVHTSELFPTVIRNTALGTSSSSARIGSAASPYIVYSQRVHPLMPFGIMAINALISGILFLSLPETLNRVMPDTVNQNTSACTESPDGGKDVNDDKIGTDL